MKKTLLSAVLVGSFLISCDDDPEPNFDYLIFGHFYGMCIGESCVETFMLTDTDLYEDRTDLYRGENKNFQLLDRSLFESVRSLRSKLPSELLLSPDSVFGHPDAGDWGGIYVEVRINGKKQSWEIDKMRPNIPDYLKPFVDEIEASIAAIKSVTGMKCQE